MPLMDETGSLTQDHAPLIRQGDAIASAIEALRVSDDVSFQRVAALRRDLAGWLKDARTFFKRLKDPAYQSWKNIVATEASVLGPKEALYGASGKNLADYEQARERERLAAEAAAQLERERLEAEAAAEAAARQVRLRKEADDARMAEAVAAAEAGDVETAERLIEAPVYVPTVIPAAVFVPPVQVAKPQAKDTSFSSTWSAEFLSIPDLVRAAAGGNTIAMACLMGDQKSANKFATTMRKGLDAVPGLKAVERRVAATRSNG